MRARAAAAWGASAAANPPGRGSAASAPRALTTHGGTGVRVARRRRRQHPRRVQRRRETSRRQTTTPSPPSSPARSATSSTTTPCAPRRAGTATAGEWGAGRVRRTPKLLQRTLALPASRAAPPSLQLLPRALVRGAPPQRRLQAAARAAARLPHVPSAAGVGGGGACRGAAAPGAGTKEGVGGRQGVRVWGGVGRRGCAAARPPTSCS